MISELTTMWAPIGVIFAGFLFGYICGRLDGRNKWANTERKQNGR